MEKSILTYKDAYIELTSLCNMRCPYCYNESGQHKDFILETSKLVKLISDLKKNSCKTVIFSGGEPFLHPDIDFIIETALQQQLLVNIVTNATALSVSTFKSLLVQNCLFQFTLDSYNQQMNDKTRGEGSFESIINLITIARKNEYINNIVIRFNVARYNVAEIPGFIAVMYGYGIRRINISFLQAIGRAENDPDIFSYELDYYKICQIINLCTVIRTQYPDLNLVFGSTENLYHCHYIYGKPLFTPAIGYDGNVSLCQALLGKNIYVGNIYEKDLYEIFVSEQCVQFLQIVQEMKGSFQECRRCYINQYCTGGCPAYFLTDERLAQCKMLKYLFKKSLRGI